MNHAATSPPSPVTDTAVSTRASEAASHGATPPTTPPGEASAPAPAPDPAPVLAPVFPLPCEQESEAVLLSFALNHPGEGGGVLQGLSPEAFHHPHHREIAAWIFRRQREGVAWDAELLNADLLKRIYRPDGGEDEAARRLYNTSIDLMCDNVVCTPASLREHHGRVQDAHGLRELHRFLDRAARLVLERRATAEDVFARLEEVKRACARGSEYGRVSACVLPDTGLHELPVKPRPALLGDFFKEGDLGFVYAPRGVGKTWLTMLMAAARASHRSLGRWQAGEKPGRVLYVDGEMHLADTKMRSAAIGGGGEGFFWLHGDLVFERTGRAINLCDRVWQDHITELCRDHGITEVYLDNLSCLLRGLEENDNDDWRELVLPWLLELRRMRISVVIVAHAGRAEHMRGASGREDQALWVLKLKPADGDSLTHGAAFISEFTKSRNTRGTPEPLLWSLRTSEGEPLALSCKTFGGVHCLAQHVLEGVTKNRELAELLNVKSGTVTKWAQKAQSMGLIRIINGRYHPPEGAGAEAGEESAESRAE